MKGYRHYLNGKYVTEKDLLISPRDLGFTRSFAVFTKIRTYNGRLFKLEEHVRRLLRSAELINLNHEYTAAKLKRIIKKTLGRNADKRDKTFKAILSGGVSNHMHQTSLANLIIVVDEFKPRDPAIYKNGVKLSLVRFLRHIPEAKSVNYIEGVRQAQIAVGRGYFEPLFYSTNQVYESSNSNIFAVKNKIMYTPKKNIYRGVMRGVLINDLKRKLKIIQKNITLSFLLRADEVFITGSGKEIVPVVNIGKRAIGDGCVGEITMLAMRELRRFVTSNDW